MADGAPFKIVSGIAPPVRLKQSGHAQAVRELAEAKIGDSFFVPAAECVGGMEKMRSAIASMCRWVGGPGWTTCRTVEGGIRVWKLAEPSRAQP